MKKEIGIWFSSLMLFLIAQSSLHGQVYSRATSSKPETTREVLEQIRQYPRDGGLFLQLKKMILKETDPEMRQQGLAVYSLGALLRGKMKAGLSARKLLLSKYPDSVYSRAMSIQNLGRSCAVCEGEGRIGKPCPVCQGDGQCPMCGGDGRMKHGLVQTADVNCPKCGGTGDCYECGGSGNYYRNCHNCKGLGVVLDKSRLKAVYKSVLAGNPEGVLETFKDESARDANREEDEAGEDIEEEDVLRYF